MTSPHNAPDAVLLITATCPNCPAILNELTQLVKQGLLGRLEIINLTQRPDAAKTYQVRSVPWFRIGHLDFLGAYTHAELVRWATTADSEHGIRNYITEQLNDGHLTLIESKLHEHPAWLPIALELISDMEAPLQARIGIGALLESLQGTPLLRSTLSKLIELTQHADQRIRSDACYYLGLTQAPEVHDILTTCLQDTDADVREIAQEALTKLPTYS